MSLSLNSFGFPASDSNEQGTTIEKTTKKEEVQGGFPKNKENSPKKEAQNDPGALLEIETETNFFYNPVLAYNVEAHQMSDDEKNRPQTPPSPNLKLMRPANQRDGTIRPKSERVTSIWPNDMNQFVRAREVTSVWSQGTAAGTEKNRTMDSMERIEEESVVIERPDLKEQTSNGAYRFFGAFSNEMHEILTTNPPDFGRKLMTEEEELFSVEVNGGFFEGEKGLNVFGQNCCGDEPDFGGNKLGFPSAGEANGFLCPSQQFQTSDLKGLWGAPQNLMTNMSGAMPRQMNAYPQASQNESKKPDLQNESMIPGGSKYNLSMALAKSIINSHTNKASAQPSHEKLIIQKLFTFKGSGQGDSFEGNIQESITKNFGNSDPRDFLDKRKIDSRLNKAFHEEGSQTKTSENFTEKTQEVNSFLTSDRQKRLDETNAFIEARLKKQVVIPKKSALVCFLEKKLRQNGKNQKAQAPIESEKKLGSNLVIENIGKVKKNKGDLSPISQDLLKTETIKMEYEDGSRYEGEGAGDLRHGKGKIMYSNGGWFEGEWVEDEMEGEGILYFSNGQIAYKGHWKNNQFDGFGKQFNLNPRTEGHFDFRKFRDSLTDNWLSYEGEHVSNTKQGQGTMVFSSGESFRGIWWKDIPHGKGAFYHKEGHEIIQGEWVNGKLEKIF